MTTPATTRNGVDVTKSGIGPCSFVTDGGCGRDYEIGAGDSDDFDHAARWYLCVSGGPHAVRCAGEADENAAKPIGGYGDGHAGGRADHVLEAERVGGL